MIVGALYSASPGEAFGMGDESRLEAALASAAASTVAWEPSRWEDLRMSPDGALPDGSRFTQRGLEQACSDLAPGLFRLLLDLSGSTRGDDAAADEYSLSEAVAVWNLALRRRFATRIRDRRALVRDLSAGTLDGAVPVGGLIFANGDFLAAVRAEVARSGRRAVLVEASLAGRRLTLRYVDRAGLARGPDGVVRHGGFFASCVEAVGEGAARAAPVVYAPATGDWALGPPRKGRSPARLARGFRAEMEDAAREAAGAGPRADLLSSGLAALDAKVVAPGGRGLASRESLARAVEILARRGLPKRSAREVVLSARHGATGDPPPILATGSGSEPLTWLHLYSTVSAQAKSKHPALRECMERVAFDLVFRAKKGA